MGGGRGETEVRRLVREQLGFLRVSAAVYDVGGEAEAKRLATSIRVLLHDTSRSISLLSQAGVKDALEYVDTAARTGSLARMLPEGSSIVPTGLAGAERYRPLLGNLPPERLTRRLPFLGWWRTVVVRLTTGQMWTREDAVLVVADKEGGAHVDPDSHPTYAALVDGGLGWTRPDGRPSDGDPALAVVRQVAWELERTLEEQVSWIAKD